MAGSATRRESLGEKGVVEGMEVEGARRIGNSNDPVGECQEPKHEGSAKEASAAEDNTGLTVQLREPVVHLR